ncbi:RNA polymerase factor sigma-54 [Solibacillus sp. NPDC093137]|uniref:RNA polymerase factor sigma-54 n=1 Tax=Solibacillus sp. NPDC093137 TaxID=3390678 RepID=UPI003CFDF4AA
MNFDMNFNVNLTQTLTQKLSMEQVQHLAILQLSSVELESYIREKANENPLLTLTEANLQSMDNLIELSSIHTDYRSGNYANSEFLQSLIVEKHSDMDFLIEQIPLNMNLSPTDLKILKYLIDHLDHNYFLDVDLNEVADKFDVDLFHTENILQLLQTFEPIGVGARDLKEFLLLQVQNDPDAPCLAADFICNHLEKVANLSIKFLSSYYKISVKETQNIIFYIKSLRPVPSVQNPASEEYIIPDISVEKIKNEWIINTQSQLKSSLTINEEYVELLKQNDENESYFQDCLKDVMLLMYGIEQRDRTLYKLTRTLLTIQSDFFEKGMESLEPINLKDIAVLLDLHESTISRAIKNKYLKTPHGIYSFKSLFPKGIANKSGKKDSVMLIKQKIANYVDNEDKDSPLTDQQITEKLLQENIKISRRTVAKYREALNILNSDKRIYLYRQ